MRSWGWMSSTSFCRPLGLARSRVKTSRMGQGLVSQPAICSSARSGTNSRKHGRHLRWAGGTELGAIRRRERPPGLAYKRHVWLKWYRRNRVRRLAQARALYRRNAAAVRARGRAYYYANRAKRIEQNRAYRAANLERLREYDRKRGQTIERRRQHNASSRKRYWERRPELLPIRRKQRRECYGRALVRGLSETSAMVRLGMWAFRSYVRTVGGVA